MIIFDKIGIVRAGTNQADGAGQYVAINGAGTDTTFGITQRLHITDKVSAQIRRSLKNLVYVFPFGDELSNLQISFFTSAVQPCSGNRSVATVSDAINQYHALKVSVDQAPKLTTIAIGISNIVVYTVMIIALDVDVVQEGPQSIGRVTMQMIGVKGAAQS